MRSSCIYAYITNPSVVLLAGIRSSRRTLRAPDVAQEQRRHSGGGAVPIARHRRLCSSILVDRCFFLRPLAVRDPSRLVYLSHLNKGHITEYNTSMSWNLFDRLVESSIGKIDLIGYNCGSSTPVIFDDSGGEPEWRRQVQMISGDGWRILGIQPALGRVLTSADYGPPVAVLSFSFWTHRFGASPTVLGRWLDLAARV